MNAFMMLAHHLGLLDLLGAIKFLLNSIIYLFCLEILPNSFAKRDLCLLS